MDDDSKACPVCGETIKAVVDGFNSGGSSTGYSDSNSWLGYGYDDWGRLLAFDCGSGNVAEYMQPDVYDNVTMTVPSGTGISRTGWAFSPGYNPSNNQVTGNTYDANGNTTADGGSNTYGYNEFSKVKWTATSGTPTCGTSGRCVTYDALGRMVETSNGSAWVELWYPQVPGARVAMNGTAQTYSYWPSPGRGVYFESSTKSFIHPDWLGHDRVVSAISSHTVSADRDYTPYGQQFNPFGSTNPQFGIFAGMPSDYNPGTLFDTPNREFAANQLRWTSPDPSGQGGQWNRYAYPTNPNSATDPSGLDECDYDSSSCGQFYNPTAGEGAGCANGTCEEAGWGEDDTPEGDMPGEISGDYAQNFPGATSALQQAEQSAQNALSNPNCGIAADGGTGAASATIDYNQPTPGPESAPADGTQFGSLATITFGDLGGGGIAIRTWPSFPNSIMIVDPVSFTNIGVWPCPGGPECGPLDLIQNILSGYGPQATQTVLVIHDLAHAAKNAGLQTAVVPDVGNFDVSLQNSATIGQACFSQGDFGGNQGPVDSPPTDVPAIANPVKHHFSEMTERVGERSTEQNESGR